MKFTLQEDDSGLSELQLGGVIYILGVVFFKMDGRIPLAHAIWHLFVVLGSFIHYFAVLNYLILPLGEHKDTLNLAKEVECSAEAGNCMVMSWVFSLRAACSCTSVCLCVWLRGWSRFCVGWDIFRCEKIYRNLICCVQFLYLLENKYSIN